MSKFDERGVSIQMSCTTANQARCEKDISCYACTHNPRCLHRSCESCPIAEAHKYVSRYLPEV